MKFLWKFSPCWLSPRAYMCPLSVRKRVWLAPAVTCFICFVGSNIIGLTTANSSGKFSMFIAKAWPSSATSSVVALCSDLVDEGSIKYFRAWWHCTSEISRKIWKSVSWEISRKITVEGHEFAVECREKYFRDVIFLFYPIYLKKSEILARNMRSKMKTFK